MTQSTSINSRAGAAGVKQHISQDRIAKGSKASTLLDCLQSPYHSCHSRIACWSCICNHIYYLLAFVLQLPCNSQAFWWSLTGHHFHRALQNSANIENKSSLKFQVIVHGLSAKNNCSHIHIIAEGRNGIGM
jgi:hypothetical protein